MQVYKFRTKLTETAEMISEPYEAYLARRHREVEEAKLKLKRLTEKALSTPATPMWEKYLILKRRGDKWIISAPPQKPPTPAKRKTQEEFAKLARMAKEMTHEEVAELVGGKVVDVGAYLGRPELRGKKGILVDGQLLTKYQAALKLLKGRKFAVPETREEKLVRVLEKVI